MILQFVLPRERQTAAPRKISPRATGHYRTFRSRILRLFCAAHRASGHFIADRFSYVAGPPGPGLCGALARRVA
jgi:hypothetical protein